MQSCLAATPVSGATSYLCLPEPSYPPEPAPEPMIVDRQWLSSSERQRRLTQGLYLYCGAQGHMILACLLRPPHPVVSVIQPDIIKMEPLTTCVMFTASDVSVSVSALIDSGSAGNFISQNLCRQLKLQTTETVYQAQSITGKPLCHQHHSSPWSTSY